MIAENEPFSQFAQDQAEYWDLFDLSGKFVRKMRRGDGYVPPELYHITVEVIATDFAGYMLVTQRDIKKKRDGGFWEFPAGSVLSGETASQAAIRELFEETGLRPINVKKFHEHLVPGMLRIAYFAYVPDLRTTKITLQQGETMNYQVITVPQWMDLLTTGLFSRNRLKMYSPKFFSELDLRVGAASSDIKVPDEGQRPVRKRKPVKFGEE